MADSAFKSAPYPAYSSAELQAAISAGRGNPVMAAEIERRAQVAAGDMTNATPAERLRALRKPAEDLTPEGIQLVIPGAERMQSPSRAQMELF